MFAKVATTLARAASVHWTHNVESVDRDLSTLREGQPTFNLFPFFSHLVETYCCDIKLTQDITGVFHTVLPDTSVTQL